MPPFTLVTTVFNEINRLEQTIADIEAQTLSPDEIVIVDAGSTDGTYERLSQWQKASLIPIVIAQKIRCNVAAGRNVAIQIAKHDLIASTDFGCRYHPQWLASIIAPFSDLAIEVVGGAFTVKEEYVNTLAAKADYVLSGGYPVVLDGYFSVSSRSIAYYKSVWQSLGGYPEWLTLAADDTIFWRKIKRMNYRYTLIDKPYVYWLRHRTFAAFGKEAYRYGLGDGESRINYRNFWSNLIETGLRYSLVMNLVLLIFAHSHTVMSLQVFCATVQLFGLRSYINAARRWKTLKSNKYNWLALIGSFYLVEVTRIAYLRGYIKGLTGKTALQTKESKELQAILS